MSLKNLLMLALSVLLVTGVVLTGGCATTQIIKDVTPQEAFTLIQDKPDIVIIDVRTPQEFAEGHIEGAINLDIYSETFRDELNKLDRNKTYLVYCLSGGRSAGALDIMTELGFREVYNMLGGINKWTAEGLPITE
ncbi:MAG: rhodanese-like domain-containing protein [Dehalococcoidia bacterium]|nr:rhodanese-like domain-containing protein [Dehalococcoidia bacterium]